MNTPTAVFMISASVIVAAAVFLTVVKCYRTGFLGAFGFLFVVLGFGSMLAEALSGVEFKILPQVAAGTAGVAVFLVQHVTRSMHFRRKRESSLGQPKEVEA